MIILWLQQRDLKNLKHKGTPLIVVCSDNPVRVGENFRVCHVTFCDIRKYRRFK